jgi:hypothetical protein
MLAVSSTSATAPVARVKYQSALGPAAASTIYEPPDTTTGATGVCTGGWMAGCTPLELLDAALAWGCVVCGCAAWVCAAGFECVWP